MLPPAPPRALAVTRLRSHRQLRRSVFSPPSRRTRRWLPGDRPRLLTDTLRGARASYTPRVHPAGRDQEPPAAVTASVKSPSGVTSGADVGRRRVPGLRPGPRRSSERMRPWRNGVSQSRGHEPTEAAFSCLLPRPRGPWKEVGGAEAALRSRREHTAVTWPAAAPGSSVALSKDSLHPGKGKLLFL